MGKEMGVMGRRQILLGGVAVGAAVAAAAAAAAGPVAAQPDGGAMPAGDIAGKSVLITGTSSGFGRLMALDMARGGAKVIASMRAMDGGRRAEAVSLRDTAASEALDLHLVEIDVTREAEVAAGVKEAERLAGGALDAVINNAGIAFNVPVELGDLEATRLIFETNLFGALRVSQAALPAMRARRKGWICTVSSQLGRMLLPGVGHYSATKFGVEALFETMAYELAPFGVDVTIIQPGGYPTSIWKNGQRNAEVLLARTAPELRSAYADHLAIAARAGGGGGTTDPMDVPHAIRRILAMAPGTRPLRRPVHPNTKATDAMNAASAQVQAAVLGSGPFAPWHKAVTGR